MKKTKYKIVVSIVILFLFASSCNKEAELGEIESLYFNYTLNGEEFSYTGNETTIAPSFSAGFGEGGYGPPYDSIRLSFISSFMSSQYGEKIVFQFHIDKYMTSDYYESIKKQRIGHEYLKGILNQGEIGFYATKLSIDNPEVRISHFDIDNILWETSADSQYMQNSPNDSRFYYEILESYDYITAELDTCILVKAKFRFVVYNESGDSLAIENGEMKSLYKWHY